MDDLIGLVNLISRRKIADDYIVKSKSTKSKQVILYKALKENLIKDDTDGMNILYGDTGNIIAFNRVKQRLRDKILNSLLTMDLSIQKYSSLKNAYYKIMKRYVIANMLRMEGLRKISIQILEDALNQSLKYEYTEYIRLITIQLIQYYSYQNVDKKRLKKYVLLRDEMNRIEKFELLANEYYMDLSVMYKNKESHSKLFIDKLEMYSKELMGLKDKIHFYDFNRILFSINSTLYIYKREYQKAIQNADLALDFFEKKPFKTIRNNFSFNSDKILSLILLKEYQKANLLIEDTINLMPNKTFNYFKLYDYKFLNESHRRNYNGLYEIVSKIIQIPSLKNYNLEYESWKIREAYVYLLKECEEIINVEEVGNTKFRLGKFLNEVPIFSKEKRGMNVSIIVVQILFYMVRKQYNNVIDRVDALKQYSFRYLKKDETYRSNCFIKMILTIPQTDFHPVRTEIHTKILFKKLKSESISILGLTNEIEIIPFHDLWEIILSILSKNRK